MFHVVLCTLPSCHIHSPVVKCFTLFLSICFLLRRFLFHRLLVFFSFPPSLISFELYTTSYHFCLIHFADMMTVVSSFLLFYSSWYSCYFITIYIFSFRFLWMCGIQRGQYLLAFFLNTMLKCCSEWILLLGSVLAVTTYDLNLLVQNVILLAIAY